MRKFQVTRLSGGRKRAKGQQLPWDSTVWCSEEWDSNKLGGQTYPIMKITAAAWGCRREWHVTGRRTARERSTVSNTISQTLQRSIVRWHEMVQASLGEYSAVQFWDERTTHLNSFKIETDEWKNPWRVLIMFTQSSLSRGDEFG